MKYILNWNDEELNMVLVDGPLSKKEAEDSLKERVVTQLMERSGYDVRTAVKKYEAAQNRTADSGIDELNVYEGGASFIYGSGYEDRYQIVEYTPKLRNALRTVIQAIFCRKNF